ncbi:FAR-17a/AIG1-like protein [Naematelia encephala]|uniref:FAR-17a/AIG1-like protein n=1 Tax=Naematelia encephala TaxID=71784 RepID=A0A1Y2AT43_9TREE|nr:FAR-17a/AIG1-like protein [Naematelia encephala]
MAPASSMHSTKPLPEVKGKAVTATPKIARLVFHSLAAALMANGFAGLQGMTMSKHIQPQYGGHLQYLTILGLIGSGLVMLLSAASDMLPSVKALKKIKRTFLLFALPVELVISSIYWPLVLLAPHLMFPPNPDLVSSPEPSSIPQADLLFRIPLWMDLSMHALPAAVLLLDFFALERRYTPPASTFGAPILAFTFGGAYANWIEHCASINGKFPYPFLTVLDFQGRVAVYVGASVGALLVFWGLNAVHR